MFLDRKLRNIVTGWQFDVTYET